MDVVLTQAFNGLVYSSLLFLLSAGLSLIFGLMNVVNIAHGSFYMLGAFFALAIADLTGSFWLALLIAPFLVAIIGIAVEMGFIRPLYRRHHLDQVLLTFGFTLVFYDLVKTFGGTQIYTLPTPAFLSGSVRIFGNVTPVYNLFLVALGFGVGGLLWLFIDRSRIGAMVRASVDDPNMAAGVGINVGILFTSIFATGAALAGLAGVAAGPELGIYAGMDVEILIPAFIVIVIGGTGNLRGAFGGSIIVGEADTFGKAYLPDMAMFLIYIVMIAVLLTRPEGLFGRTKTT